jgi:DNA-binding protein H-NS
MSVEALLKLRDDIGRMLSDRADDLRRQLAKLGGGTAAKGPRGTKGRKVAPKYRDPKTGETWAARGARPRWLQERLKQGHKIEDFLIAKPAKAARKKAKRGRRRKAA